MTVDLTLLFDGALREAITTHPTWELMAQMRTARRLTMQRLEARVIEAEDEARREITDRMMKAG